MSFDAHARIPHNPRDSPVCCGLHARISSELEADNLKAKARSQASLAEYSYRQSP